MAPLNPTGPRTGLGRLADRFGRSVTGPLAMGLALLALLSLVGCARGPVAVQYQAERDLWKAIQLERRAYNNRDTMVEDGELARRAFERVLLRYPRTAAGADETIADGLGQIRCSAALGLSRLLLQGGDAESAIRVLADHRRDALHDLNLTLHVHQQLIQLLSSGSQNDSLALVLREMAEELPAGTREGEPIPMVLEAPLQAVDALEAKGEHERATFELDSAVLYYRDLVGEHPGTALEVAAWIQLAKAKVRQGRFREAEEILERSRTLPAAGPFEARILFSQASLRQEGLKDFDGAIQLYREMVRRFPQDEGAPEAHLMIGQSFSAAGSLDSALAVLDRFETVYPRETDLASQARLATARVLALKGEWQEALRRLRFLNVDFPRTAAGLLAPIETANYYERMGEKEAVQRTLEKAAADYERIARELTGDPSNREMVLMALDHLFEVHARLGDWVKAVDCLLTRAEGYPNDVRSPLAYVQAAAIQEERLGNRAGAITILEKLTARYPNLPLSRRAAEKIEQLRSTS